MLIEKATCDDWLQATLMGDAEPGQEALHRIPAISCYWLAGLPGIDGCDAARELRRREGNSRHTAVIALTALDEEGEWEKCLQAGMDDYLSKPIKLEALTKPLIGGHTAFASPPNPLNPGMSIHKLHKVRVNNF